jgi:hypothetical protein
MFPLLNQLLSVVCYPSQGMTKNLCRCRAINDFQRICGSRAKYTLKTTSDTLEETHKKLMYLN